MAEFLLLAMLGVLLAGLISGYPVAFVLAGVSLLFALIGNGLGVFDLAYIAAFPTRIYGVMTNDLLIAVPLFVFMGVVLERAQIAEELLRGMAVLMGRMKSGLGVSVMVVGCLLAASTGIVGATVVTMGLISLPTMLKSGYNPRIACGSICAAGTLGQVIPPSIVLILLGDQISSMYQTSQMQIGNLAPTPVSIADLFVGALVPGFMLVVMYIAWFWLYALLYPKEVPATHDKINRQEVHLLRSLLPPLLLIIVVLGSILGGLATATESASVGAVGALLLAYARGKLCFNTLKTSSENTAKVSAMVFSILIGAAMFSLVFRGYGGDGIVHDMLVDLPGGLFTVMLVTMLVMFLLGFFLDFIEILFVVVPIIAPILFALGAHPIWLAVMIAVNLQTSFLTPPFGFALFYLRGVAPKSVPTSDIYKGVIPFVCIQLVALTVLAALPELATWLPEIAYGTEFSHPIKPTLGTGSGGYEVDF